MDHEHIISQLPYFIRAIYEWVVDNNLTPYILVLVNEDDNLVIPQEYVDDGKIILNISPSATADLHIGNDFITFKARFNGVPMDVKVPVDLVITVYAKEIGPTMFFSEPELDGEEIIAEGLSADDMDRMATDKPPTNTSKKSKKPNLTIVK